MGRASSNRNVCAALAACASLLAACSGKDGGGADRDAAASDSGRLDAPATDAPGDDTAVVDAPATDAPGDDTAVADAPATDAPRSDAGPCSGCVSASLAWGTDGGLACTRDSSALAPCRAYTHRRVAEACDPPDIECTNEIPACEGSGGDSVVLADVEAALAHADVVAAIAAAPVLYGTDPRAFDGSVFFVTIGAARVEVGPCATPGCADIPAGVRALQTLLGALDAQEIAIGDCAGRFPGG